MSKEYNDEKTMLSERKTELLRKINDSNSQNTDFTEDLRKIIEFETVDKTTLFNLIEKDRSYSRQANYNTLQI